MLIITILISSSSMLLHIYYGRRKQVIVAGSRLRCFVAFVEYHSEHGVVRSGTTLLTLQTVKLSGRLSLVL